MSAVAADTTADMPWGGTPVDSSTRCCLLLLLLLRAAAASMVVCWLSEGSAAFDERACGYLCTISCAGCCDMAVFVSFLLLASC